MNIEIKRKELELIKVSASRAELEFKVLEKEDEINRIKQHIKIQLNRENELKEELKKLGEKLNV